MRPRNRLAVTLHAVKWGHTDRCVLLVWVCKWLVQGHEMWLP